MSTEIRVTRSGRVEDSDVDATIVLTKRLAPGDDPGYVAELLRGQADALLARGLRKQIGPAS